MKGKIVMWIVTVVLVAIFVYSLFFAKPTYKVTFDTNGGNTISSVKVKKDEVVKKPADPTKEGYIFKGWQVNGVDYNFDTPVTGNITITAVWEEKTTTTTTTKKGKKTTTTTKKASTTTGKTTTTAKKTTTKKAN
jgi:uncharacterized repeat protein (TIGR02543 family)